MRYNCQTANGPPDPGPCGVGRYCRGVVTFYSTNRDLPMAEDYYKTLGVSRSASQAEIQQAYRKLARKYHPDLNPDDPSAAKKFQEVQKAFEVLNDPQKRENYDRYGEAFEYAGAGGPGGGGRYYSTSGEDIDFSQLFGGAGGMGGFADLFEQLGRAGARSGKRARARRPSARGSDVQAELQIPFQTAVTGGNAELRLARGNTIENLSVKIPSGIEDGQKIRLRGQGEPGFHGGPSGDLIVKVNVSPHPYFQRQGQNLVVRVPLTLGEALAGAKVDVPTPYGPVSLKVPPGTSSGAKLRIREHGITRSDGSRGDLLAEIQIVLPKQTEPSDQTWATEFDRRYPLNPRDKLRW